MNRFFKGHSVVYCLCGLFFTFLLILPFSHADVLRVPADYSTIQAAIDAATHGDTIQIAPGYYNEVLSVTQSLILEGSGMEETIIDGEDADCCIRGSSASLRIQNLKVQNALTGIWLSNSPDSKILNCWIGPLLARSPDYPDQNGLPVVGIRLSDCLNYEIRECTLKTLAGGQGVQSFIGEGGDGGSAIGILLESVIDGKMIQNTLQKIQGGLGSDSSDSSYYSGWSGGIGGNAYGIYSISNIINSEFLFNVIEGVRGGLGGDGGSGFMVGASGASGGSAYGIFCEKGLMNSNFVENKIFNIQGSDGGFGEGGGRHGGSGGAGGNGNAIIAEENLSECFIFNNLIHDVYGGRGGSGASGVAGTSPSGSGGDVFGIKANGMNVSLVANNTLGYFYGGERGSWPESPAGSNGSAYCFFANSLNSVQLVNNIFLQPEKERLLLAQEYML